MRANVAPNQNKTNSISIRAFKTKKMYLDTKKKAARKQKNTRIKKHAISAQKNPNLIKESLRNKKYI